LQPITETINTLKCEVFNQKFDSSISGRTPPRASTASCPQKLHNFIQPWDSGSSPDLCTFHGRQGRGECNGILETPALQKPIDISSVEDIPCPCRINSLYLKGRCVNDFVIRNCQRAFLSQCNREDLDSELLFLSLQCILCNLPSEVSANSSEATR